jgi:hypothetical protein
MCPVESFVPILASACQVSKNIRRFAENVTNEGLTKFFDVVLAFKNPTKMSLRVAKNSLRDFILTNSERFFNGNLFKKMPCFNIADVLDGLSSLSDSLQKLIGLTIFQSSICSLCGYQGLERRNSFLCDVGGWLGIFPSYMKIVPIITIIESISQRTEKVNCNFCGFVARVKCEYFDPKMFVIFSATRKQMERIFWNKEIAIKRYRYRMIGVTRSSGRHFYGEVFDHTSRKWLHYNSCYETLRDQETGYTLKSLILTDTNFQGVFKDAVHVHYVRVE